MLWKQFERPEQGIREEATHVALRSQRPRKQPAGMGLQAGEHQTQQPKLALTALQPHEPPVRVNVECIRAQALEGFSIVVNSERIFNFFARSASAIGSSLSPSGIIAPFIADFFDQRPNWIQMSAAPALPGSGAKPSTPRDEA